MSTFKEPASRGNAAWKEEMKAGKMKIGCAINSASALVTEIAATQGFDFLLIDQQHSAINPETLMHLLQACHAGGCKAIVRIGGAYDRIGIQQALDLGADGILVPCSRTVKDVEHAVSCAKYPVKGPGSVGGSRSVYVNLRPQLPGGFGNLFNYVNEQANKETIVAVQIETKDALENIEGICAVPGVDIAFIGPGDLSVDMGLAAEMGLPAAFGSKAFADAEARIAKACKDSGVIGGYWNPDVADKGPKGFRFLVVDGDVLSMQAAFGNTVADKKAKCAELGM